MTQEEDRKRAEEKRKKDNKGGFWKTLGAVAGVALAILGGVEAQKRKNS